MPLTFSALPAPLHPSTLLDPIFTLPSTFTMADKKETIGPREGLTDGQWNQKGFKRAFKPYAQASERRLGFLQVLFRVLCHANVRSLPPLIAQYLFDALWFA
jgi:hypothetical protein